MKMVYFEIVNVGHKRIPLRRPTCIIRKKAALNNTYHHTYVHDFVIYYSYSFQE